ncbi:unnamed protein product [Heligmosomoides polygyrus]|uniref:Integrase catalytic domain-containing protein n=1 Tax=Heligmosomoides polygyrus TaxID=6339 RepID=A0A3P8C5D8_HELPZ|nr:unnamed protein product [Heligmosomoides polygyrus]
MCNQFGMFKCQQSNLRRVRTRITNSALPEETINPIFLPRENFITALFIQHVHQKNHHCGSEQTLIELRKSASKGRITVKRTINKLCFLCEKLKARPFKLPDFPTHPTTCLNCRAITTDILQNLSSKTFLQSFRRLIANNGCPKLIICDNAPTSKAFSNAQMEEIATIRRFGLLCTTKDSFQVNPSFQLVPGRILPTDDRNFQIIVKTRCE